MRERAARIGSKLTIESKIRGGTHVQLDVPARIAYAGFDSASSMWGRFMGRWTRRNQSAGEVSEEISEDE
jgi:hypothetical protein